MRKTILCLAVVALIYIKPVIAAGNIDFSSIKLNSMNPGDSPLPILVSFSPKISFNCDTFNLTIAQAWGIDAAGITLSYDNLPNGFTGWPVISSQNVPVNNRTAVISCGRMEAGKTYGFYITGGIGLNKFYSVDDVYKWQIVWQQGITVIDQAIIKSPVAANSSITITANVPTKMEDIQVALRKESADTIVSQGDLVNFAVDYGNLGLNDMRQVKLVVEWDQGVVESSPINLVDLLEYSLGSATSGYNGTPPVIDGLHRQIIWTINRLPANTSSQTVRFGLKTKDAYEGESLVKARVRAHIEIVRTVTPDQISEVDYRYYRAPIPTAYPTQPLPSPTPGPVTVIETVTVKTVEQSKAQIETVTRGSGVRVKIILGKSVTELNESVTSIDVLKRRLINLEGLEPDTVYYFRVVTESEDGKKMTSELFTFRTAEKSSAPSVDPKSLAIVSNDTIVNDRMSLNADDSSNPPVIPQEQKYNVIFRLKNREFVSSVAIDVKSGNILGVESVYGAQPITRQSRMLAGDNGLYVASLNAPKDVGLYEIYVRILDFKGNVEEAKIGSIIVSEPITITNSEHEPIEAVSVLIKKWDDSLKLYINVPPQILKTSNPVISDSWGRLNIILIPGKYQLNLSAPNYKDKNFFFELSDRTDKQYPKISMEAKPFSIFEEGNYIKGVIGDVYRYSVVFMGGLLLSKRFMVIVGLWSIATTIFVFNLILSRYWGLPPEFVWLYILEEIKWKIMGLRGKYLKGLAVDKNTGLGVADVNIYLLDADKNRKLSAGKTDTMGYFSLRIAKADNYKLVAGKRGYLSPFLDFSSCGLTSGNIRVVMEKAVQTNKIIFITKMIAVHLATVLFEANLVATLLLEYNFWKYFGWKPAGLGMMASIINLTAFLIYFYPRKTINIYES